jgi:hypothetical protein
MLLETLKVNADVDTQAELPKSRSRPDRAGFAHPRRLLLLPGALQIARALLRQSRCGMHQVAARCL